MKIKNILPLAAILCGLLILFAAPQPTVAENIPPGSYQQTCKNIKFVSNHIITAACRTKQGDYVANKLRYVFLCYSDISNQNGQLTCHKDFISRSYGFALNIFSAASVIVLGRNPTAQLPNDTYDNFDESEPSEMLRLISDVLAFDNPQDYYAGSIKLTTAVNLVKKLMHERQIEDEAINNAYQQVYHRKAQVEDFNKWIVQVRNGSEWYSTIVLKLQKEKK